MKSGREVELALALTNLPLLLLALCGAVRTARIRTGKGTALKGLWVKEFALIFAASLLGVVVHGLDLPALLHRCVWTVLFALLYALADGVSALALLIAGAYGPASRAASLIPASALLGVSLFLHWSGRYGQDLIPFSAYAFAVVASSVLLLVRRVPWGPAGGKTAALAVLTAGAVVSTALFDRHPFLLFGFQVDGSVVSHLLDALALLLLLDLAAYTVRKEDGAEEACPARRWHDGCYREYPSL